MRRFLEEIIIQEIETDPVPILAIPPPMDGG